MEVVTGPGRLRLLEDQDLQVGQKVLLYPQLLLITAVMKVNIYILISIISIEIESKLKSMLTQVAKGQEAPKPQINTQDARKQHPHTAYSAQHSPINVQNGNATS